jgi:hypothetical protein
MICRSPPPDCHSVRLNRLLRIEAVPLRVSSRSAKASRFSIWPVACRSLLPMVPLKLLSWARWGARARDA